MTRKERRQLRRFIRKNEQITKLLRGIAEHCEREKPKLDACTAQLDRSYRV